MEQIHQRNNRIFALLVFAISFVAFIFTVAPTVAFWDCGEYIAAGHSLGIPHPPGNPLFMLMFRASSLIFSFFEDVGYRMNFLVVLFSAATASVIYLIAVRIAVLFTGIPDTTWKRLTVYIGGIVAGLFAVFGSTFWFSAVEASEANPSMFFVALSTLLALIWAQSKSPNRDRLLVLLTYVSFLGVGVHMYSMISLPPIFLFVMLIDKSKRNDWRIWLTTIAIGTVLVDMVMFIYVGPIAIVTAFFMGFIDDKNRAKWNFCAWLAIFAVIGFSSHIFIPIRSALDPMINENHPETWSSFVEFLQRKQYGSESMFERMFWRRGAWSTQFGIDGHMGYGGFHLTQFFKFSPTDTEQGYFSNGFLLGWAKTFVYLIPTFMMLYAWWYLYKKNATAAIFLISLFLVTSVGLVLYMNFADGTLPEKRDYDYWVRAGKPGPMPVVHREVRIRDYFFGAAFMFLGMWVGIASSAIMHYLFTNKDKMMRVVLAPIAVILFAVSPVLPMVQNWNISSRKGDFVPFDYAYNLLMSCEKDGVLFTNGDNDTFPLWALQEAYGIRRDVRIVNLSLLNTKWYIKQLKDIEPKVFISYSSDEIDALNHELNPLLEATRYRLPQAGITLMVPGREQLNALRIQDKMVLNIVDSNKWRKPIYFAVTVSDDNKMGIDPYLQMQGLVYRVNEQVIEEANRLDVAKTVHLLDNVYRFTGLGDGKARLNDTSEKLLSNYAASYLQIALTMRGSLLKMKSDVDALATAPALPSDSVSVNTNVKQQYQDSLNLVLTKLDQCVAMMPWDWRPRMLRHEYLMAHDKGAVAEEKMKEALKVEPTNADYKKMLIQALEKNGKKTEVNKLLKELMSSDNDPWSIYATLAQNYEELAMYDSAIAIMEQFGTAHPGDRRASMYIDQLKQKANQNSDTNSLKAELNTVN